MPAPVRLTAAALDSDELEETAKAVALYVGAIASIGFVGGAVAYALAAAAAFIFDLEIDLLKFANHTAYVVGFGALAGVVFYETGLV